MGCVFAADNPATQSDPSGLNPEPTPGPGGGYGSACTANPDQPGCNQPPPSGPGNPGAGGGTTGGAGNAGGGCPSYDPGCPGFTGGGAGQGGELPVALAATPQPLQAVWACIPGGCSGRLLWLRECGQEATDLVNLDRNDPSLSSPWQLLGMVGLAFTGVGDIADVADAIAAEEAGAAGTEAAARAANPARFAVGGDGTVTVRGTEGFYRSAELQEALENLQTASQDAGTVANAGVDVARGPAATGTLQPPGPTLGGYAPPVPTGLPDLSTAIPAVVMAGTAVWMAAQYWWNVWFG